MFRCWRLCIGDKDEKAKTFVKLIVNELIFDCVRARSSQVHDSERTVGTS